MKPDFEKTPVISDKEFHESTKKNHPEGSAGYNYSNEKLEKIKKEEVKTLFEFGGFSWILKEKDTHNKEKKKKEEKKPNKANKIKKTEEKKDERHKDQFKSIKREITDDNYSVIGRFIEDIKNKKPEKKAEIYQDTCNY